MKHLLLTTIAVVVLVGCATTQSPKPPTAKAPDISIHEAAGEGDIEAVKQHLDAGTDVNVKRSDGMTPLHFVKHKEVAELLIAKGADVNAKNKFGWTPLYWTAYGGHKEIVKLFIAKGAAVNAKDDDGRTPLDMAIDFNHTETADLLRKHGGKTGEELKAEAK